VVGDGWVWGGNASVDGKNECAGEFWVCCIRVWVCWSRVCGVEYDSAVSGESPPRPNPDPPNFSNSGPLCCSLGLRTLLPILQRYLVQTHYGYAMCYHDNACHSCIMMADSKAACFSTVPCKWNCQPNLFTLLTNSMGPDGRFRLSRIEFYVPRPRREFHCQIYYKEFIGWIKWNIA